jgi:short-subunit dehydrogenase
MVERGGGHVVAIASLGALAGFPYEAAYCGSKAALFTVIESARAELATKGVTFTTACPGFIRTPMLDGNAFTVTSAMPPEAAAARIHRAIGRRQPRLYFPRSTYWMIRLSNVLPVRLRDYAARRAMKWR